MTRCDYRSALTLVELVIIVVVLGILAAIAVPRLAPADRDAVQVSLDARLLTVRNALELYRIHEKRYPTMEELPKAIEAASSELDAKGERIPATLPHNPYTDSNTIGNGAVGTSAWYYDPATGEFRANDSAAHRER